MSAGPGDQSDPSQSPQQGDDSMKNSEPDSDTSRWRIKIKTPNGEREIEIDEDADVTALRNEVSRIFEQAADRLCLVYGGKIMKDGDNIKSYGVKNNHSIHLVVRAQQAQRPNNPSNSDIPQGTPSPTPGLPASSALPGIPGLPAGMQNMDQLLDNPLVQNMFNNPELLRSMVSSNPQIQNLMERHPELSHALNNPDVMRQAMQVMRNPNMMQEMMRNYDRALSNLESVPGGFNALQRFYSDYQEPMYNAMSNPNPFASLAGNNAPPAGQNAGAAEPPRAENSEPLPNPWGGAQPRPPAPQTAARPAGAPSQNPFAALAGSLGGMDMGQMMNQMNANPQLMDRAMQAMNNPEYMRLISDPRGIAALGQLNQAYRTLHELAPSMFPSPNAMGVPGMPSMGDLLGAGAPAANAAPANNVLEQLMQAMARGGGGLGANPTAGIPTPAPSTIPPEQRFREQLATLESMGFCNRQQNIAALTATFGDVNAAVERLLQAGGFPQ